MESFSVTALAIPDVLLVQPRKFADHRRYFQETYSYREFARLGIANDFVQDNQSRSVRRGTVRGLHFQLPPHPQAKLVRVLRGAVYDVAVDLRHGSATFGRWCSATLSAEQGNQLFIPRGFAHGFCTLEPNTEAAYRVDTYYAPECDTGLVWDDPDLRIDWPTPACEAVLSARDAKLPRLADFRSPFAFVERT
jgi:dTDP-4-dehydrorhamnose 3,5-epimerase